MRPQTTFRTGKNTLSNTPSLVKFLSAFYYQGSLYQIFLENTQSRFASVVWTVSWILQALRGTPDFFVLASLIGTAAPTNMARLRGLLGRKSPSRALDQQKRTQFSHVRSHWFALPAYQLFQLKEAKNIMKLWWIDFTSIESLKMVVFLNVLKLAYGTRCISLIIVIN